MEMEMEKGGKIQFNQFGKKSTTLTLELGRAQGRVDHLLGGLKAIESPKKVAQVEAEGKVLLAAALDGRLVVGDGSFVKVRLYERLPDLANKKVILWVLLESRLVYFNCGFRLSGENEICGKYVRTNKINSQSGCEINLCNQMHSTNTSRICMYASPSIRCDWVEAIWSSISLRCFKIGLVLGELKQTKRLPITSGKSLSVFELAQVNSGHHLS